ncbi:MAG: hypothetical protein IPN29_01380 [Saprospiraceae bacterium]|nr:hypothetical protein [Saprospiraceae bacterium]
MSVLIFIDMAEGHVKKFHRRYAPMALRWRNNLGTTAEAIVLGAVSDDLASLGKYGVKKIHHVANDTLNHLDAQVYTKVIAQVAAASNAKLIIFSNNLNGKAMLPAFLFA